MAGKRKQHTETFKARVAPDAVRGIKTLSELSAIHKVHSTVIAHWKRQLLDGAAEVLALTKLLEVVAVILKAMADVVAMAL